MPTPLLQLARTLIARVIGGLILSAWATLPLAQMSNSTAQSQGLSLGSGLSSSGSLSPNSLANSSAVAPNNANNIYGAQANGVADPNLTSQSTSSALAPLGAAKVGDCASQSSKTTTVAGQDCAAVNFLSGRCAPTAGGAMPAGCPQSLSANDPMFTGNLKNINTATFDASLNKSCHSVSTIIPAQITTNRCDDILSPYISQCTNDTVVTMVNVPSCTPGQFLATVTADPCPGCLDYLVFDFTCESETSYNIHAYTNYHGGGFFTELGSSSVAGGLGTNTPKTLGPNAYDGNWCYSVYYAQVCGSTTCNIGTWFTNPCQGTSYYGTNTFVMPTTQKVQTSTNSNCGSQAALL